MNNDIFSEKQRNDGNIHYKKYDPKSSMENNLVVLKEALKLYNRAYKGANSFDAKYKAMKNTGLAYEKMLEVYSQNNPIKKEDQKEYISTAELMTSSYTTTLINGGLCLKNKEYNAQVERITASLTKVFSQMAKMNCLEFLESIACLIQNFRKIFYYLIALIAQYYFNEGMFYLNNQQCKVAKTFFEKANQIINQYYLTCLDISVMTEDTISEFLEILSSCNFYIRRTQVIIILEDGDMYFKKAIFEKESIDMDDCFQCLDKYREALMLFQNEDLKLSDIELEAECISKIAFVMVKIFKFENKAYTLAMECITLSYTLSPKNFMNEKWYVTVIDIADEIRSKQIKEEEKASNKEYYEFKEKNEELIQEINDEAKKDYKDFAKFCRKKYPFGEIKSLDVNKLDEETCKKVLLKMIPHYHPDKQSKNNEEEQKIYFLKQEITKFLNAFYNKTKLDSTRVDEIET